MNREDDKHVLKIVFRDSHPDSREPQTTIFIFNPAPKCIIEDTARATEKQLLKHLNLSIPSDKLIFRDSNNHKYSSYYPVDHLPSTIFLEINPSYKHSPPPSPHTSHTMILYPNREKISTTIFTSENMI